MKEESAASRRLARVIGATPMLEAAIAAALAPDGIAVTSEQGDSQDLDILVFVTQAWGVEGFVSTTAGAVSERLGSELKTAYFALKANVAAIRAKGVGGAVVFVAAPSDGQRSFDALRQGLRLLTKSAALELGPEGIRVNIVLPGSGETPLGRACTDADIAAGVAFAASDRAHFMTGADLVIDGGRMVQ